MKRKRLLSGTMAGIMTVSSAMVMQMPASAEMLSVTMVDSRAVQGWNCIDINLSEYGIMNSETVVTVTCRTSTTDITQEEDDGSSSTPSWAFGIVIDNEWSHEKMPHCNYESSKTEFSMRLTAEQLNNNPVFTIQSQLPVEAEFTVAVSGLQQDDRAQASLPAVSGNVPMWVFSDSSWLSGSSCGGTFAVPDSEISGVTYNTTTIGELRKAIKSFSTKANPYYSDSLGMGSDALVYSVQINYSDGGSEDSVAGDNIDYCSDGVTYMDLILPDDSRDSCVVTGIGIYVSAKTQWNGELQKSEAVCEALRSRLPGTNVLVETAKSTGKDLTLDPCSAKSVEMNVSVWDDGTHFADGFVSLDPGELSGITFAEFLEKYHTISIAAPGYFGSSADIKSGDLVYDLHLAFMSGDGSDGRWLERDLNPLTEDCTMYTGNYADMLDGAEDYTLASAEIRVSSRMEQNQPASEVIRGMESGSSFVVEFAEDKRENLQIEPGAQSTVEMSTWSDSSWLSGSSASGRTNALTVPGVTYGETTFAQLKDKIKSLSCTLPYSGDSINAGKDAFCYKFLITFADGSELYGNTYADLGAQLTQVIDDIDETQAGSQAITGIFLNVEARLCNKEDGKQEAVSETIRGLSNGSRFYIETASDDRQAVEAVSDLRTISMEVFSDSSWLDGVSASGMTGSVSVPGVNYGETTFAQLKQDIRKISLTLPYFSDSAGAGSDAFVYKFAFEFSDGTVAFTNANAALGKTLSLYIDAVDESGASDSAIVGITLYIDAKTEDTENGRSRCASPEIRALEDGGTIILQFREDTRETADVMVSEKSANLSIWTDDSWLVGATANGSIALSDIPGVEYGKTTLAELRNTVKSLDVTVPYHSDSVNAGKDAFVINFIFTFADGSKYSCRDSAGLDTKFSQYLDEIGDGSCCDKAVSGITLGIESKRETLDDGKQQAVSEAIRGLTRSDTIVVELEEDTRVNAEVSVPTGPVHINAWDNTCSWYDGIDLNGSVRLPSVPGVEYGKTTFAELREKIKSISCTLPYYTDTLGLGREAFKYELGFTFEDGTDMYCYTSAAPGEKVVQYIDSMNVDDAGSGAITAAWLGIQAASEERSDGKTQAASEAVRALKTDQNFVLEPAKDERGNVSLNAEYPSEITLNVFSSEDEYSSSVAFQQITVESDITGASVRETLDKYRSFSINCPGYFSDGLSLGKDGFNYQIGMRVISGGDEYYLFSDETALDKSAVFYSAAVGADNLNGFVIDKVFVKISANTARDENGKLYSVSDKVGRLEPGSTLTVYTTPTKPQNVKATAGDKQVVISWDKVDGAVKYVVYSYVDGKYAQLGTCTANSYTAKNLTNGKKYGFYVKALVNGAWSDWSSADLVYATPKAN